MALLLPAAARGADPPAPTLTYEADVARVAAGWKNRIFLVVADAGPCRASLSEVAQNPTVLYRKRRVGCAVYLGERRLLLTTASVVRGNGEVEIFNDRGLHSVARIVGRDPYLDIALLEASEDLPSTEGLPSLQLAPEIRPGSECLVLGNAYGHSFSAVLGTVGDGLEIVQSGLPIQVIRVNAAFFPGDSGGAVLDWQGRFLGMITAISHPRHPAHGIEAEGEITQRDVPGPIAGLLGFALPAHDCDRAWRDLREHGRVRRGYLGVSMSLARKNDGGARILSVLPGSPADRAGIRPGDIVIGFDRSVVTTPRQLYALVAGASPGGRMDLQLLRGPIEHIVTVELTEATVLPPVHDGRNRGRVPALSEPLPLTPTTETPVASTPR
jgi:serine protease Do